MGNETWIVRRDMPPKQPIGEKSYFAPRFPLSPITIGEISIFCTIS